MASVVCPRCGATSTGFFCGCGADLRALYPDSVPTPKNFTPPAGRRLPTVAAFLEGLGLAEHLVAFEANGVTSEMLAGMTDEDLRQLGVSMLGHRKKLLAAAGALGKPPAAPSANAGAPQMYEDAPSGPSTPVVILAIASFIVPGLGQLIQGRVGAGVGYFLLAVLIWAGVVSIAPGLMVFGLAGNVVATLDVVRSQAQH